MSKPLLSIGIIFKNEIRCLERCVKSLAPLREAVPCELVMADTGSDDGSRDVAEQYADILFDFPWINDFAAARNAVMDRCSGKWYLSVDADEWLEDAAELIAFAHTYQRGGIRKDLDSCTVCIRNYLSADDFSDYHDFYVIRMVQMSEGIRYKGRVHEYFRITDGGSITSVTLPHTVLLHDGYIDLNEETGKAKRQRNQALLDVCLEQNPDDVRSLMQYIEASRPDPQHMDYVYRGLEAVETKKNGWKIYGPVIFRYAVMAAHLKELPELENQWIHRAAELFPESFYTNIDIAFIAFINHWDKNEYLDCIPWGEKYLSAMADFDAGRGDREAQRVSTLVYTSPEWVWKVSTSLSVCYRENGQIDRALELLEKVDPVDGNVVKETLRDLREVQVSTNQNTTAYMLRFYQRIAGEKDEKRAKELMTAFVPTGSIAFGPETRAQEAARSDFHRYSYTVFAPLAGKCGLGTAAAVMKSGDPAEIAALLGGVEKWNELPYPAVSHAVEKGVPFPLPGRPLKLKEMESLAKRLAGEQEKTLLSLVKAVADGDFSGHYQRLFWAHTLAAAAVQNYGWEDAEPEPGLSLAETFVRVERAFCTRCYMPEVLCEENVSILPPLHRFGWYCGRAFDALDSGDAAGYVRHLREGLTSCESMKNMVAFLRNHTPELQRPKPSGELLALAEKVRAMLAAYPADDPAVAAIKGSPVYQKVARLIEGPELMLVGGLKQ